MAETKVCNICSLEKPLTDFHVNKLCNGGRDNRCRDCKKKQSEVIKKCGRCGDEFLAPTKNAKYCSEECRGRKSGNKKQSLEEIKRFIEIDSNSGCLLVSTERDERGQLVVNLLCKCGTPFSTRFYYFKKRKRGCDCCNGAVNSIEHVRKVAEEKGCTVISETYVNNRAKMKFRCSCGESFTTSFKSLNQQDKTTCDTCTKEILSKRFCKSNEKFDKQLFDVAGNEIVRVGDYRKMGEKVLVKHVGCGKEWPANPSDLLHKKSGCPFCVESKGEKRVAAHLTSLNLNFERQYKMDDCKSVRPLPFDFAVFYEDKLSMLIEYDGVQHFDKTCFGGKNYKNILKNDKIKNEYCSLNSITLLRISYKEFENIETIINDALSF